MFIVYEINKIREKRVTVGVFSVGQEDLGGFYKKKKTEQSKLYAFLANEKCRITSCMKKKVQAHNHPPLKPPSPFESNGQPS